MDTGSTMATDLVEAINALSPEEQEAVPQFVQFLQTKGTPSPSPVLAAVDEFIEGHREVLRRPAQ
jgi:hypothetical protein